MGRKAKVKQRRRAKFEADIDLLCHFVRTTCEGSLAAKIALGAAIAVGGVCDALGASDLDEAIDAILEHLETFVYDGCPGLDDDASWSEREDLDLALAALERLLGEAREGRVNERAQRAGKVALLAGQIAVFADPREVEAAGERASQAVRLASRALPKRQRATLIAEVLSLVAEFHVEEVFPDESLLEALLAGESPPQSDLTSGALGLGCCPCCC